MTSPQPQPIFGVPNSQRLCENLFYNFVHTSKRKITGVSGKTEYISYINPAGLETIRRGNEKDLIQGRLYSLKGNIFFVEYKPEHERFQELETVLSEAEKRTV